jgi:hypothetical protein
MDFRAHRAAGGHEMNSHPKEKARRGSGLAWSVALQIVRAFYRGMPWLAIGLAIGVGGVR